MNEPTETKAIFAWVGLAVLIVGLLLGSAAAFRWPFALNSAPEAALAPPSAAPPSTPTLPAVHPPRPLPAMATSLPRGALFQKRAPAVPLSESKSGTAKPAGRLFRLDTPVQELGKSALVCLDAPQSAAALAGVQPTCQPLKGWPSATTLCSRNDAAAQVPLTGPVTWRVPCP